MLILRYHHEVVTLMDKVLYPCNMTQYLPEKVIFKHCIYSVKKFIPGLKMYYNFYRFNHVKKHCRGKTRYLWCGKEKQGDDHLICDYKNAVDKSNEKCILCKGGHWANDKNCPHFIIESKLMFDAYKSGSTLGEIKSNGEQKIGY